MERSSDGRAESLKLCVDGSNPSVPIFLKKESLKLNPILKTSHRNMGRFCDKIKEKRRESVLYDSNVDVFGSGREI